MIITDSTIKFKRGTTSQCSSSIIPLLEGEGGYNTTTGSFKIGDGESLWDELPDIRKQFQNVVTVSKTGKKGTADFICSTYDSDDECIQDALNNSNSGDIIHFGSGVYDLNDRITQYGKSLTLITDGDVTFNFNTIGDTYSSSHPHLYFAGTQILTTTVSSDVSAGSWTIQLSASTNVATGDLLSINKNVLWCPNDYPTMQTGELYEIKSVSGNIITLSQPILRDYLISSTVNVEIYRPIEIIIDGFNINFPYPGTPNPSETDVIYQAIFIDFCKNSMVKNCTIRHATQSGINFGYGYNVSAINNQIFDGNLDGSGYGIGIWSGTAFSKISENHIENCRHCITANSYEFKIQSRAMLVSNNTLIGTIDNTCGGPQVIDSHCVIIDITVENNVIYPNSSRWGSAFAGGAKINIFKNNTIYGGGYVYLSRGSLASPIHVVSGNISVNLDGSFLKVGTGGGGSLYVSDNFADVGTYIAETLSTFSYISIKNNKFKNFTYNGLLISSIPNNAEINISNNEFSDLSGSAITINGTSGYSYDCTICNNNIKNPNNVWNGTSPGISLSNITHAVIDTNRIVDHYQKGIGNGISLGSGCDYNKITNNVLEGMTGSKLSITGTHNIIRDNSGYVTENTGTATITAGQTSVTVSHGLAVSPTRVQLTPTTATAGKDPRVSSKALTTFTITIENSHTADISFDWSAVV